MKQVKYIGMDVQQATISVSVLDDRGKLIMECILETKAATILEFLQGLQGNRVGIRRDIRIIAPVDQTAGEVVIDAALSCFQSIQTRDLRFSVRL